MTPKTLETAGSAEERREHELHAGVARDEAEGAEDAQDAQVLERPVSEGYAVRGG